MIRENWLPGIDFFPKRAEISRLRYFFTMLLQAELGMLRSENSSRRFWSGLSNCLILAKKTAIAHAHAVYVITAIAFGMNIWIDT